MSGKNNFPICSPALIQFILPTNPPLPLFSRNGHVISSSTRSPRRLFVRSVNGASATGLACESPQARRTERCNSTSLGEPGRRSHRNHRSMAKHGKFAQISTLKSMPGYHLWSQDLHVIDRLAMFQENPWLSSRSLLSICGFLCFAASRAQAACAGCANWIRASAPTPMACERRLM